MTTLKKGPKSLQFLVFVGGIGLAAVSALQCYKDVMDVTTMHHAVLDAVLCVFGIMVAVLGEEGALCSKQLTAAIEKDCLLLALTWGRGCFYIFVGENRHRHNVAVGDEAVEYPLGIRWVQSMDFHSLIRHSVFSLYSPAFYLFSHPVRSSQGILAFAQESKLVALVGLYMTIVGALCFFVGKLWSLGLFVIDVPVLLTRKHT
jgi:hypothetical protein